MMLRKTFLLAAFSVIVAAALLIGAACGDDDNGGGVTNQQLTDLQAQVQKAQLLASLSGLSAIPFHEIDDNMQKALEVPPEIGTSVDHAYFIAKATEWPDQLKKWSDPFVAGITAFRDALAADNLKDAKGASAEAHATWHELLNMAYPYVAGEAAGTHSGM